MMKTASEMRQVAESNFDILMMLFIAGLEKTIEENASNGYFGAIGKLPNSLTTDEAVAKLTELYEKEGYTVKYVPLSYNRILTNAELWISW